MSERCEEFGPLLAAWIYDEVDAEEAAAVEEHLAGCPGCRQRRDAYVGIRGDLQEWQPPETPRTITFIGAPTAARKQSGWLSWTARAAAVAASFVLGLGLTAAAVNLQIHHDDQGWTLTTGLWSSPGVQQPDPASSSPVAAGVSSASSPAAASSAVADEPDARTQDPAAPPSSGTAPGDTGPDDSTATGPAATEQRAPRLTDGAPLEADGQELRPASLGPAERQVLRSWLDQELSARGLETIPTEPADSDLTETERRQIYNLVSEVLSRQETEYRMYLNDLVSAMETRQQEQLASTLTNIYENLEAERRDAVFMLASQLGLLEVNHGEELALTNAKLDYLLSQMSVPASDEQRRQENR